MPQIASYTVGLRFNPDKRSIVLMDRQLKQFEKNLIAMQARIQKTFAKSFVLPALTVKKFNFDSLALQRGAQMELNRVGRLLEMKVSNIKIDQSKINSQVQSVFQRAANNARMNVKSIAGTGGGGNPFPMHNYAPLSQGGGGNSFIGIPRLGGAGLLGGGLAAGAFMAGQQVNNAQNTIAKAQTNLLKLRTSGSTIGGQPIEDALLGLSNEIGVNAESQVDAFSRFLKQTKNANMTSDQGFKLFKDMSIATRGNGGDQQSIERQAYAMQQILGLGYLRSEELNQQLADSNPAIKGFIQKAYAERSGKDGMEAFLKAMSKREVSVKDVLRGYELSAKDAAGAVAQMADSIDGERARLENSKFSEQLDRVGGSLTGATADFIKAQQELHDAAKPLRDSFYSLAAASTSLTARFLSASAKQLGQSPAFKGEASNEQRSTALLASSMGRGLLGVPDIRQMKEPQRYSLSLPSPLAMDQQIKDWQMEANRYMRPADVFKAPGSVNNIVNVAPGAIVLNASGMSEERLVSELEGKVQGIFKHQFQSTLQGLQSEYPNLE